MEPPRSPMPAQVFLRPLGSPVALGLAGLAAASLVSSGLELGWISKSEGHHVGLILLAFPFVLQLTASVLAFLSRDGALGTAIGVLAGSWLSEALVHLSSAPGARSGALGLLLLASAGLLLGGAASSSLGKLLPATVFAAEAVRFAVHGIYELGGAHAWQNAGGIIGLAVAALAGYLMWAAALEDAQDRTMLPLLRRGRGRQALEDPFASQLAGLEHEAGVRKQL
jgi:uncharacterized protein